MGVAVVIPVRNRAEVIRPTLQSLAAQTRRPEQIILVDNGSTDSTLQTLREFAEGRDNVLILSEPRPGAAEARNCGLAAVKEDYVMFFDSDDLMPPRHVEDILSELERNDWPDIGAFGMIRRNLDGTTISKPFRGGDLIEQHLFHSILCTICHVVKTEFLRGIGGWPENAPVWDDFLLGIKLLCANPRVCELRLSQPVEIIAQVNSITGVEFASRAGEWEKVLSRIADELTVNHKGKYLEIVNYRRAILAGNYLREGRKDLYKGLAKTLKMRLIARYVAAGGRGVQFLYRIIG